jgi:hypothetical protein
LSRGNGGDANIHHEKAAAKSTIAAPVISIVFLLSEIIFLVYLTKAQTFVITGEFDR